jgi:hypothetical protein
MTQDFFRDTHLIARSAMQEILIPPIFFQCLAKRNATRAPQNILAKCLSQNSPRRG